ncbi:MAG: DarT ssDNA thymidine ADP-ribosyltransferase family protein [Gammaproteobacteria bacterium]|nr:DarT ssDNA thymidine ADP-ribosyltransferase family protein [Gammaproteobacteria bacterium]
MNFSDHLTEKGVKNLFYLTALENLESILERGILCRDLARQHIKVDISSDRVQRGRMENFPNVHQHVPLYFAHNTPMLYVCVSPKRGNNQSVILLKISSEVANFDAVCFSDGKTANGANLYTNPDDLKKLDWEIINSDLSAWGEDRSGRDWPDIRSSEIFVPKECDAFYIRGIYFQSRLAEGWSKVGKILEHASWSGKIFVENSLTEKGIW